MTLIKFVNVTKARYQMPPVPNWTRRYSIRHLGLAALYVCSFPLFTGVTLFVLTWKWFPIADLLRAALVSAVFLLPLFIFSKKFGTLWLVVLYPALLLPAALNLGHILIYETPITTMAVQSILETTPAEGREFFDEFFSVPLFAMHLCLAAIPLLVVRSIFRSSHDTLTPRPCTVISNLLVGTLSLIMLFFCVKKGERLVFSHEAFVVYSAALEHRDVMAKYADPCLHLKPFDGIHFLDQDATAPRAPRSYIFVIGESANRNHLGVYGYFRDTTPKLQQRRAELSLFSNIISGATHTIPSLRKILLVEGDETASLIDLFNQAGFKTWWLSNQTIAADGKHIGTAQIVSRASVTVYTNMARDEGRSTQTDEVLLPELHKALEDPVPNKVIFLHLLGSHLNYALRYPASFNYFQSGKDNRPIPAS